MRSSFPGPLLVGNMANEKRKILNGFRPAGALLLAILSCASLGKGADLWKTLPPTPGLPQPLKTGYAPVNGIQIWYAVFGEGHPVLLLHGGLANSNYWGNLVPV